jgi:hypothetical protein
MGNWDPTDNLKYWFHPEFVFQDDDDCPFWMNEQKRAEKKEDKV